MFTNSLRILCVLGIFWGDLHAGIEQYFKKAEGKPPRPQMRSIDYIYMINLDQRPEKYESCIKQLSPYGIEPYRFSAVNGWELTYEILDHLGVKFQKGMHATKGTRYLPENKGKPTHYEPIKQVGQTYFSHCLAWGAVGCCLSHLSVLQDAYDSGYETIWVVEDDVEIIRDPHLLSDLIDTLDTLVGRNGWDVLYTDRDTKNNNGEYCPCLGYAQRPNFTPAYPKIFKMRQDLYDHSNNPMFRMIGSRYGTYSMIIRRSGMKKILDFLKTYKIFLPIDMEIPQVPTIRLFTVYEDVVSTQPRAVSDNGGANYLQKLQ